MSISNDWYELDSLRQGHLEEARRNAEHSDWTVLPPVASDQNTKMPLRYQSIGPRGIANLTGLIVQAMIPPGMPWLTQEVPVAIRQAPDIDIDTLEMIEAGYALSDLIIMGSLEQASLRADDNRGNDGLQSSIARIIRQLLITGDVLALVQDDLRIRLFRNDHYVTLRDAELGVVMHITKESLDPLTLNDEQFAKLNSAKNRGELAEMSVLRRVVDLYTKIEWNPVEKCWDITKAVNDQVLETTTEKISPYICLATSLMPGSNHGRAFFSRVLPEVVRLDALAEAGVWCAAICSDVKWAIDEHSNVREDDIKKPPMSIVRSRVRGGQVEDIAVLQGNVGPGYNVIREQEETLRREIARTFLLQDEMVRNSERTTAVEVRALINQLNQALGDLYTPIADMLLRPLAYIARDKLMKQKKLPKIGDSIVNDTEVKILTGTSALAKRQQMDSMLAVLEVAARLGPEMMSRINLGEVLDSMKQSLGVTSRTFIKSEEQVMAEANAKQAASVQEQAAVAAAQSGANAAGNVVQQVATQQLVPQ
jgi:hypothetical protein